MNLAKYMDKWKEQKVGLQRGECAGKHSSCSSDLAAECKAATQKCCLMAVRAYHHHKGGEKPKQTHNTVKEIRGTER